MTTGPTLAYHRAGTGEPMLLLRESSTSATPRRGRAGGEEGSLPATRSRRYRSPVARLIERPSIVEAAGRPPKTIREHVGRVNTGTDTVSVAHMSSPPGWAEPWQTPDFDEWTLVLSGSLLVEDDGGQFVADPGQTVHAPSGHRVRYSTPGGAEYVAVCVPAFSADSVHRDGE